MATVFLTFSKPTQMPRGGMAAPSETVGFDSVNDAAFIASAVASGAAAVGSQPTTPSYDMQSPVVLTRIKFVLPVEATSPAAALAGCKYNVGDIAGFLPAVAVALISQGFAVAN